MMNIKNMITASLAALITVNLAFADVITLTEGSTTGYTMTDGNTYVVQDSVTFSNSTAGGSGMSVEDKVVLFCICE